MGFGTPDEEMIRGPLRDTVAEAINDPAFRAAGWIVPGSGRASCRTFSEGSIRIIAPSGGCLC